MVIAFIGHGKVNSTLKELIEYENAKINLCKVSIDADRLIEIIEKESNDIERRTAFIETTFREICAGADYSRVENMDQLAEVYAKSLIKRLDL